MAMKSAFHDLTEFKFKTRDASIMDLAGFQTVELSVLLCNDDFIKELNKEWRDENHATDVLSMSQHVPELNLPIVRTFQLLVKTLVQQFIMVPIFSHLSFSLCWEML